MAINFAPGPKEDPFAALLVDAIKRRQQAGQALQKFGSNTAPAGIGEAALRVANGALGGYLQGQAERERKANLLAGLKTGAAASLSNIPVALGGSPEAAAAGADSGGGSGREKVAYALANPDAPAASFASGSDPRTVTLPAAAAAGPDGSASPSAPSPMAFGDPSSVGLGFEGPSPGPSQSMTLPADVMMGGPRQSVIDAIPPEPTAGADRGSADIPLAPAGVDSNLWQHMTPEERALWQK